MIMQTNDRDMTREGLVEKFFADPLSYLHSKDLDWQRLKGSPRFDYPIDYSVAVTKVDPVAGLIEFLAKWAPNA